LLGYLDDGDSFGELGWCLAQLGCIRARTPEALSNLAMLREEAPVALDLILDILQPSANACAYNRPL
jgi:hypothetical protein